MLIQTMIVLLDLWQPAWQKVGGLGLPTRLGRPDHVSPFCYQGYKPVSLHMLRVHVRCHVSCWRILQLLQLAQA
jgi:hypothetical protein